MSRIVTTGLSNLFPNLEVISEEDETHNNFGQYGDAILVDPIDGTGTFNRGKNIRQQITRILCFHSLFTIMSKIFCMNVVSILVTKLNLRTATLLENSSS